MQQGNLIAWPTIVDEYRLAAHGNFFHQFQLLEPLSTILSERRFLSPTNQPLPSLFLPAEKRYRSQGLRLRVVFAVSTAGR